MHIDVTLKVAVTLNNSHLTGKHLRGNNRKVITVIFLQDTSWFDSVSFEARHEICHQGLRPGPKVEELWIIYVCSNSNVADESSRS